MKPTAQALLDSLRPSPNRAGSIVPARPHRWAHGTGLAVFLAFSAPVTAPQISPAAFQQPAAADAVCAGAAITRLDMAVSNAEMDCLADENSVDRRNPRMVVAAAGRQPAIRGMRMLVR